MDELERKSAQELAATSKHPLILVLDDVRSMQNVGSAFRTADAFGVESIYLCGITPCPPHRDIHKTALGATETVVWHYEKNIAELLLRLKTEGYRIAAVEQTHESTSLSSVKFDSNTPTVLIFGNEVNGVSEEALSHCDLSVEIPQWGNKHSLNIAVCVGIVCWEMVRQLQ